MNIMKSSQLYTSPEALQHSQQLAELIAEEVVHAGGKISFARFMELALYAPQLGYYMNTKEKLGSTGDFVTAPEISPLFSQCVARQCQQALQAMNKGSIIEFGPGKGTMAYHILMELAELNTLPEHYYLVELSASLKQQQEETLKQLPPDLFARISWLDNFPLENPVKAVVLANEVLDAMPVHRFKIKDEQKLEVFVGINEQQEFCWQYEALDNSQIISLVNELQEDTLQEITAYESEINLNIAPWLQTVAASLSQGMVLIIDYGYPRHEYYHPDRTQGTLICHYQHHTVADPLILPGLMDITSHVDFSAVGEAAEQADLEVVGYVNQAKFLINCGLLELVQRSQSYQENEKQRFTINQAIKRLTLPSEMGELVKVMALTKNMGDSHWQGFI